MDDKSLLISKDLSFKDITSQEKFQAIRDIAIAAVPNILSSLGSFLKDVISLYFIGHLNNPLLFAAFGFGLTWISAFGTAVAFGFSAGFGTLASQAYGAGNYKKLGVLYQKSIVVNSIVLFCLSIFLWFTETILVIMGFEAQLASLIGQLVRYLIIDIFLSMLFGMTQFYLISQNKFDVPAKILLVTTGLHILWCHLFINVFELGLSGMALARTATDLISVILILLYVRMRNPCPESWFPWTPECLDNLVTFTKDLASYGSSIYMEWVVFEITTMIIGAFGDVSVLAAHTAAFNYMLINSTISLGVTLSTTVLVGNAAGEGCVRKAKKYTYIGLLMNLGTLCCLDFVMLLMRDNIALFYTEEPSVRDFIKTMLTMYFFGMHADMGSNTLGYLLRTLGQDRFVLKGFVISYYGVGIPCSLTAAMILGSGFTGVWISLIAGFYVMFGLTLFRLMNLKWEREINKISNEMKKPLGKQEIEMY